MEKLRQAWHRTPTPARRILVLIIGALLIVAGIFMLVLPGPGWATIFLGLAVLATEFERAERLRAAVVRRFKHAIEKAKSAHKR